MIPLDYYVECLIGFKTETVFVLSKITQHGQDRVRVLRKDQTTRDVYEWQIHTKYTPEDNPELYL